MHPAIAARILAPVVADLLAQLNERMITMLPLYQCHKIVEASKIIAINPMPAGGPDNAPEGEHILFMEVGEHVASPEWMQRHNPQVGGYFVKYPDGYLSYSPAKAFEEGYMALPAQGDAMYALHAMRSGQRVARHGWNGKGMWLQLQVPDEHSKMTLPYIYLNYPASKEHPIGARVPWVASQTDMLANDWYVLED